MNEQARVSHQPGLRQMIARRQNRQTRGACIAAPDRASVTRGHAGIGARPSIFDDGARIERVKDGRVALGR
jgi:hypothetical protein